MYTFPSLSKNDRQLLRELHKKSGRKSQQRFLVEGSKMIAEGISSGYQPEVLVLSLAARPHEYDLAENLASEIPVYTLGEKEFERLADTQAPQGIIATFPLPDSEFDIRSNVIVCDSISDPGNMGTILRTADWFGVGAVCTCGESVDIFSPKVVRASMGAVFRVQSCHLQSISELSTAIEKHSSCGAVLGGNFSLRELQSIISSQINNKKIALVVGNEARGIRPEIIDLLDYTFEIEGNGHAESLNVSAAHAIACYELFG